ncbi:MAG: fatty acid desaturase [Anaerolineales bacterium]|nr:fatty acid desaturase [Anaerolineales bacterium]
MTKARAQERVDELKTSWRQAIASYQQPDVRRSIWQLVNTLGPYFILLALMYWSLGVSYWLTLLLAIPASGLLVRNFIIFHDCGHESFFESRRANTIVGYLTGILVFTPYHQWRHHHAIHHATAADLDRRGVGDVWTMTLDEYRQASTWKRFIYRAYRHPVIMFVFGSLIVFLINHRFPAREAKRRERNSVHLTNLAILGILVLAHFTIGLRAYVLIQLPVIWFATLAGVWLFYVQHQFDGVYWERHERWDFVQAALEGSSFYKLPKVLQWFSGNIGFHHIHHLSPRIPNYNLERCYRASPVFQVKPVTLVSSLKSLGFRLWDESNRRLVGFKALKQTRSQS